MANAGRCRWRPLSLLGLLVLAACGAEVGAARARPAAPANATPAPRLVSLTAGDRACYVELRDDDGPAHAELGGFELCPGGARDSSALIGQRVRVRREPGAVSAAACEGAPDCPDSETVDLVVDLIPAR